MPTTDSPASQDTHQTPDKPLWRLQPCPLCGAPTYFNNVICARCEDDITYRAFIVKALPAWMSCVKRFFGGAA